MRHCLIITGGSVDLTSASAYLKKINWDVLIAADHGMDACRNLELIPDIILGDFDSVHEQTRLFYQQYPKIIWYTYPSKKDETDTELALHLAISKEFTQITILGASGTRLDHTYANLCLLNQAQELGIDCKIVDKNNRITLLSKETTLYRSASFGKYISFFPFQGEVKDLSLKGFIYDLEHEDLPMNCIKGISNEFAQEKATVQIGIGKLLCIESID